MFSNQRRRRVSKRRVHLESLEPRRLLATYTVDTSLDENDGNHGTFDFSLREAIAAAATNPGADTINFNQSRLFGDRIYLTQGPLLIQSSLTINGASSHISIDADGASGVFVITGGVTVSISGLSIHNGHASLGAGLKATNSTVTLTRMTFRENDADIDGGAIYSDRTNLRIIQSDIYYNTAGDDGGGVFAIRGSLVVHNSRIAGNAADATGGGIACSGPVAREDPDEPAMYFSNTIIGSNTAGDHSGGVAVLGNAARFVNCSIMRNRADKSGKSLHDGGGIRTDTSDASTTLFNTIVAGNRRGPSTGAEFPNDLEGNVQLSSTFNLIGSPSSSGGLNNGVNGNKVGKNGATMPFDEIARSTVSLTYFLANNSPAHDAGSNARAVGSKGEPLNTDQRGSPNKRILDGPDGNSIATVDMGAIEMRLPELDFSGGVSGVSTYIENATPTLILPPILQTYTNLIFGDYFGSNFTEVNLRLSLTANAATGDRVTVLHQGNGPYEVGVQGSTILYGNVAIGSFSPSTGAPPLQISLSNVDLYVVQHVMRRIAFSTGGNNPSSATRTVLVELSPFQGRADSSDTITVAVVPQNDAPILDNSPSPILHSIEEDAEDPGGTLVSELLAGAVTDPDAGAVQGMAITAASDFYGVWQYTFDGGATWQAMGEPSSAAALLLRSDATTQVRFLPAADFNGEVQLYYRAWDRTHGTTGGTLNTFGNTGGTKSLSFAPEHAALTVTPVNDAPLLVLGGTVDYDLDADAITLAPSAAVSDIDSRTFAGGQVRVQITNGASSSNHLLIGAGFTVDADNNVLQGTTIIGRRAANGRGTNALLVTFTATVRVETVQQLVRAITFKTAGGSAGDRKIVFTVSDGAGGLSAEATKLVHAT